MFRLNILIVISIGVYANEAYAIHQVGVAARRWYHRDRRRGLPRLSFRAGESNHLLHFAGISNSRLTLLIDAFNSFASATHEFHAAFRNVSHRIDWAIVRVAGDRTLGRYHQSILDRSVRELP